MLGPCPNYTWRSILSSRDLVIGGSRWLVGDGSTLELWKSIWLPHPISFKPITPRPEGSTPSIVSELIDKDMRCWTEDVVRDVFMPCDDEVILNILRCTSWPKDKLIWHYTQSGQFSVRSAYHLKIHQKYRNLEGTSHDKTPLWKTIWSLDIPPRVRMFAWRLCHRALPTGDNIAKRISGIDTKCAICGHILEMDVHVLLWCLLAT